MKSRTLLAAVLGGLAAAVLLPDLAWAQGAAPQAPTAPTPNKGDTAWMLVSSALVLMMSVPGLALFYGGLVRSKNMLSVLTQVFAIVCLVGLLWVFFGYSLAFTNGGGLNPFVGGFSKAFLRGITPESTSATFSNGVVIPEYVYVCFQMTFAMITPALIVGAFAERMRFSALMLFIALWVTFVYLTKPENKVACRRIFQPAKPSITSMTVPSLYSATATIRSVPRRRSLGAPPA
jgi:ammonium transporter, Amt family